MSYWLCACVCACASPPVGLLLEVKTCQILFAATFCTDGNLVLKGTGRAIIPEVIADQQGESSAGQEPTTTSAPPMDPVIQTESTALWKREGSVKILLHSAGPSHRFELLESNIRPITQMVSSSHCTPMMPETQTRNLILQWRNKPPQKLLDFISNCLCSFYFWVF